MNNPVRKHIPTSAQVLKEQKERADREREARLAAGRKVVAQQPAQLKQSHKTTAALSSSRKTDVAVPDTRHRSKPTWTSCASIDRWSAVQ